MKTSCYKFTFFESISKFDTENEGKQLQLQSKADQNDNNSYIVGSFSFTDNV